MKSVCIHDYERARAYIKCLPTHDLGPAENGMKA